MSQAGASWLKVLGKSALRLAGLAIALPCLIGYGLCMPWLGRERAFSLASERLALVPGLMGIYTRQVFYGWTADRVGADVCFGFMSVFSKPGIRLGEGVYVGRFCSIGLAEVEDHVMIADGVQVLSGRHQHGTNTRAGQLLKDNTPNYEKVTLGQGAWIGAGAVVMADVGEGAVVAAGAVVVKPVAAYSRVAGVPAEPIETAEAPDTGALSRAA